MKQKLQSGLIFLSFLLFTTFGFSQSVFINEIHYDNVSYDSNEGIEIAGPAGTDLSGWTLVEYNGSDSQTSGTNDLTGVIPDQQNGFGTLFFDFSLQNGPDGVALVDNNATVIQFLSYEDVIIAANGPAAGMTSVDITVSEPGDTPENLSLQLSGNGTFYQDFTWNAPTATTYNFFNNNQIFGEAIETTSIAEARTLPVETEVTISGILTVSDQFGGPAYIQDSTGGIAVYDSNIQGTGNYQIGDRLYITGKTTEYSGLIELTNVTEITAAGSGSITPAETSLNQLEEHRGELVTITDVNFADAGLDFNGNSNYEIMDASGSGQLRVDNSVVSVIGETIPENCTSVTGVIGRYQTTNQLLVRNINDFGCDLNGGNTGGDAQLVINEVDADTPGGDELEFIEIYDGGLGNTSLEGYTIVLFNGSDDKSNGSFDLDGYSTDENGYFVIGNPDVANVDFIIDAGTLQNGEDAVALYKANASDFPQDTPISFENLIDAFVYETGSDSDTGLLSLLNSGGVIDENGAGDKDNHSSQRFPNGSGDIRSTLSYIQALATPGVANTDRTEVINLVINEIDSDTKGYDAAEFIELYDGGDGSTSLDGFVIVLFAGSDDQSYSAYDLDGYATDENGYFVIGNPEVANVSYEIDPGRSGVIQNGPAAVSLYLGNASDFPNDTPITFDNLIDAVVYGTGDATDSGLLPLLNSGEAQLDEDSNDNKDLESLQRMPNGEGGVRNTLTFQALEPTPGTENGVEVIVPHGELITIAQARMAADGEAVTVEGTLTVTDQFYGPAYLQDETGAIAVYDEAVYGDEIFEIGTSIKITATKTTYNGQIELIDVVRVDNLGEAAEPVLPLEITLDELSQHPDELVTVSNVSFKDSQVGRAILGNDNFDISDVSGDGALRIDNGTTDFFGKAIPESCSQITGIAADVYFNIIPRNLEDFSCVEQYDPNNGIDIPMEETLDVIAWNLEWFGAEGAYLAPAPDEIQKEAVKNAIISMNADVIAVEEVTDAVLFDQMVSEMDGYEYVLSDAVSHPELIGLPDYEPQKVGFIYKTDVISVESTKVLLESVSPYYNGGDESLISDYPTKPSEFFASGRLPFLMNATATINGNSEEVSFVVLHAKANTGSDAYVRRKYDAQVLKDSLDEYYANANLVLLGDYNDDVDETVFDGAGTTESSYSAFINDPENYWVVTKSLSEQGLKSTVGFSDMIDHITITNELFDNYIETSSAVHYEFFDADYANTTSDHFPVSLRLALFNTEATGKNSPDMVQVCFNGHPQFVSENAVDALLKKGAVRGSCDGNAVLVTAAPNPVDSMTMVSLENFKNGQSYLTIYSLSGNILKTDKVLVKKGTAEYELNMDSYLPGLYIIEVKNSFGQISYTKVIKN